ncbi:right-handed parallel beta-helix repeat-containing protein [Aetokthonos hydrillicola Thurmond2011]|jgi:serine/threonine protein kinase|uniref:Right-handed parallel beta-helix repeat-containing protein n=1 Tax=Aetokthonos hydrillicola Thurmond2011 TaxID=2712845 RepID=A0AAP5MD31_9CYAN|nr:right-handed parallel beta-helix repeat-containing protein [Aetokthonos hydrillicola]MBO3461862.1 hypothetical protein [Aetokthonos hydrillicola CCALA 1050]MBW4588894.1 right-handed parallel beta-helix repeat-containing protein [Aetokthonos hydrillicola CCALA 1050]MDR9900920.1 right-handed parallel beta-helix repeat-containing protein [Aetokthonos hydrillicola Thurmond2011]
MPWPKIRDYQIAIQNPNTRFNDPELRRGVPVMTSNGLPRACTGGFAIVYKIDCGTRKWAIRCFQHNQPERKIRYEIISKYLKKHNSSYFVNFEFQQVGIKVNKQWYPIIKMEWVEGKTLREYIQSILRNSIALKQLADRWLCLVKDLKQMRIAHGDLSDSNVLVVGDKLKLIDYDGMFVPPLTGTLGLEVGNPDYQHPKRTREDFSLDIDNFSALAIYTAIKALSEQPQLWTTFDNGQNILFRRNDFRQPQNSQVFAELKLLANQDVVKGVKALQSACFKEVSQVLQIEQVIPPIPVALPRPLSVAPSSTSPPILKWMFDIERTTVLKVVPESIISNLPKQLKKRLLIPTTINEAIRNAKPGDTILVPAGIYQESLIIDKPVQIVGIGSVEEIIIESINSSCILMGADYAEVRGLTLRCRTGEKNFAGVDIPFGELLLENCDITSDHSCIHIHGSTAKPVIRNCQIHHGKYFGLLIRKSARGIVEGCNIIMNEYDGVHITSGAELRIQGSRISGNGSYGVRVVERGKGTAENCDLTNNGKGSLFVAAFCKFTRHNNR